MPYAKGVRLGKKPGTVHDERTLHLARLLTSELPPPPKTWRIARDLPKHRVERGLTPWPMFGNDALGDCSCVTPADLAMAQEWNSGQRDPVEISLDDVINFYSLTCGYVRGMPQTDNGGYPIEVLRAWRNVGFGREADGSTHKILAFARVDETDESQMRVAAKLFNGLYLGLALSETAEREISAGKPWSATTGPGTDLYSWGGHATAGIEFDAAGRLKVATWGEEQWMTRAWRQKFVDEAWCVISEDSVNRLGRTSAGFDVPALEAYMARL